MKKVTYLMILMFAMVLMTTSCEKTNDDDLTNPTENGLITLNQLNGTWKTVSYINNGVTYIYNSALTPSYIKDLFRTFTFNSSLKTVNYVWTGNPNQPVQYDFTKDVNEIQFDMEGIDDMVKEKYIVSYFKNDTLKLNFTYKYGYDGVNPTIYGTYILTK